MDHEILDGTVPRHPGSGPAGSVGSVAADRALSRRSFLLGMGGALAASACSDRTRDAAPRRPVTTSTRPLDPPPAPTGLDADPFTLGVASGDPLSDGVILWTRLAPDPLVGGGMPPSDADVLWEVAADEAFEQVVQSGIVTTTATQAHSAHVDVAGLDADTAFHYRFRVGAFTSAVGRTRTLPPPGSVPDRFAFTASACQDEQDGVRTPDEHLAAEDAAFNLWLGDYIYETENVADRFRPNGLPEATDLAGYRHRYAFYKSDPALQDAHATMAWVVTWDDHEVANNYAGLVDQLGTDPAAFALRRAAAYQAWWEHQPVRMGPPTGPDLDVHRVVDVGDLLRLVVLDTRQHRDDQACDAHLFLNVACGDEAAGDRTMLGNEQLEFLGEALGTSTARWNAVGQGVLMTPLPIAQAGEIRVGLDAWDGYPAERAEVCALLEATSNPVVLSGDFHSGVVADLPAGGRIGGAAVATEFAVGSISSAFPRSFVDIVAKGAAELSHIRHFDNRSRGYLRCEVTPDEWRAEFRIVETTLEPRSPLAPGTAWVVPSGQATASPA